MRKTKIKITNENGITLVALVITIVILIILATITINVAFGEGGLIERAQQARELTEQATKEEAEKLNAVMSEYGDLINGMNKGGAGTNETDPEPVEPEKPPLTDDEINGILQEIMQEITTTGGTIEREDIIEKLTEKVGEEGTEYTVSQTKPYTIIFTDGSNKLYLIDEDGSIVDDIDQIWIKLGESISQNIFPDGAPETDPPEALNAITGNRLERTMLEAYKDTLKSLAIPETVQIITIDDAYNENKWEFTNLSQVYIPNSVTTIGDSAFYNCPKLSQVYIPDSVTRIAGYAFYDCTSLNQVYIPDSLTTIGMYAFSRCSSLSQVYISKNFTEIRTGLFNGCSSLNQVYIPDGVTVIMNQAFSGCTSLSHVYIPDGVTTINANAFANCTNLTTINIPNSVTTIDETAFEGCTNLKQINIDNAEGSITGENWGAEGATINWKRK